MYLYVVQAVRGGDYVTPPSECTVYQQPSAIGIILPTESVTGVSEAKNCSVALSSKSLKKLY